MGVRCVYSGCSYELPVWVNNKIINDYLEKIMSDKDFALTVLLLLLSYEKDSSWCCNLQKFFDSQVYNINVID